MVATTAREENGEFCVAVAPATRTAGILTQLVKGAGCYIEPAIRLIWVIYWLNSVNLLTNFDVFFLTGVA